MAKCKACGTESEELTKRCNYDVCLVCSRLIDIAVAEVKRLNAEERNDIDGNSQIRQLLRN